MRILQKICSRKTAHILRADLFLVIFSAVPQRAYVNYSSTMYIPIFMGLSWSEAKVTGPNNL